MGKYAPTHNNVALPLGGAGKLELSKEDERELLLVARPYATGGPEKAADAKALVILKPKLLVKASKRNNIVQFSPPF